MAILVRSWNLFHGYSVPPARTVRLHEMLRLVTADEPDVVCLQEVPAWGLGHLGAWTGMEVRADVARRPSFGPLPIPVAAGRVLTDLGRPHVRGLFEGQANAVLLGRHVQALDTESITLNDARFRHAQARWLALGPLAKLAWAREPRRCLAVRIRLPAGRTMVVANLHATSYRADERLPDAELLRAAVFADTFARPDETCVLAGDFNVRADRSWTIRALSEAQWGFEGPGPGVDHILVRGASATPTQRWSEERRRYGGVLLSDHAPVERMIE